MLEHAIATTAHLKTHKCNSLHTTKQPALFHPYIPEVVQNDRLELWGRVLQQIQHGIANGAFLDGHIITPAVPNGAQYFIGEISNLANIINNSLPAHCA
jgi:prepilin-type processing-associated H-X9-DG protein